MKQLVWETVVITETSGGDVVIAVVVVLAHCVVGITTVSVSPRFSSPTILGLRD